VILTGNAEGTPVSRTVAVNTGIWVVKETDWSWAYTPQTRSYTREIKSTSTEEERLFSFSNTADNNAALHDESIVINVFGE